MTKIKWIATLLLTAFVLFRTGAVTATPFGIMFESDANVATNEVGINTYASLSDIFDANASSTGFTDINVNAPFSTTGITWDGTQFVVMFESDANVATNEVGINTYASLSDIFDANASSTGFTDINVNAPFSTTGITWDGTQFVVMFESDANVATNEVGINTYASLSDIFDANASSTGFTDINVNAPFSTTGITWDGTQFVVMFESDANVATNEVGINTYASLSDIFDANASSTGFTDINVNAPFSTTGLYSLPSPASAPEPNTLAILGLGLAGLAFARRRKAT